MSIEKKPKPKLFLFSLILLLISFIAFLLFDNRPLYDPYYYDAQDLPQNAVNGKWLAQLTSQNDTGLHIVQQSAVKNTVVRVQILEERHEIHPYIEREYWLDHIFSIYCAEVLEIYTGGVHFSARGLDVGDTVEFAQIKRIAGRDRQRWFEHTSPPTFIGNMYSPVRLPISIDDELVVFLKNHPPRFLNPINGVYRYSSQESSEGNRAFESVNEHNSLILTEEDLAYISEMFSD
jgi:hypothetical protein